MSNYDALWEYADAPWASERSCPRQGKWLLFSSPEYHAAVWETIKTATEAGTLGISAKTTSRTRPDYGVMRGVLTCVYTCNYDDLDDVRRVLVALRGLGFARTLSYKTDEDTLSGRYGKGVSIYVSPQGSRDFEDRRTTT